HIEQPYPFDAGDGVQASQQAAERASLAEIVAVERRVLRDEQQLLHAARAELLGLADDLVSRARRVLAAKARDDAEGTGVITALRDLHVRVMLRRRQMTGRLRIVDVGRQLGARAELLVFRPRPVPRTGTCTGTRSIQCHWYCTGDSPQIGFRLGAGCERAYDVRHFTGAEHCVDLRDLRPQLVAIPLRETAGDDQAFARAGLLQLRHLEDR